MVDESPIEALTVQADLSAPTPRALKVGWVAAPGTLERFGRVHQPLAIGLMDEMVAVTAVHPVGADLRQLPTPPILTAEYRPKHLLTRWPPVVDELAAMLKGHKLDMLHALEAPAIELTSRLAEALNLPYVVSSYALGDSKKIRRAHVPPRAVLAASTAIMKALRRGASLPSGVIHLLRPGVYQVRQATCFNEAQYSVTIVVGGRLDDLHAHTAVVKAFNELRSRNYDCIFFILGSGKAERQIRAQADRMAMRQWLTFADAQPLWELPGIFKSTDVYISPVPSSALDIECLLAMAAGVPVLACAEGAADFIRNGQTSLMYNKDDWKDLAQKLVSLLDDHAYAQSVAHSALAYLRENHSAAGMVQQMSKIYRSILE